MNYPTYEFEKGLHNEGFNYIAGVDEVGRGCEKIDAEVLTDSGWKTYKKLALSDKVLSYTDNDTIEWQKINEVLIKGFKGDLIELKNKSIHICVTSDHCFDVLRRTFKRDSGGKLRMTGLTFRGRKNVNDLNDNDFIPRGGKWVGNDNKYFILPAIKKLHNDYSGNCYDEKKIPIDIWVAFIGIYLAEGYCIHDEKKCRYKTSIAQVKKPTRKKIKKLLDKLPFEVRDDGKKNFTIYNKQLSNYMKQFGNCYNKFIPNNLKNLSSNLLNILIDWMVLGDGACYTNPGRKEICTYYTTSKRLSGDFEEIVLKTGRSYKTTVRKPRDSFIRGRLVSKNNCKPCYETRLRRNISAAAKFFKKSLIEYNGDVFCLSLPKYHNFYVRRNGTGYFTGNCGAGPVVSVACRIPEECVDGFVGGVKDSKKISEKKRYLLYEKLISVCDYGVGIINNNIIDEINILEATKLAMRKAINDVNYVDCVVIDGPIKLEHLNMPQYPIIKGDNSVLSIAAASIIAKVIRDSMMESLHKRFPVYKWDKNKGYLTKEHREALKTYGSTEFHRKSFKGVL